MHDDLRLPPDGPQSALLDAWAQRRKEETEDRSRRGQQEAKDSGQGAAVEAKRKQRVQAF